MLTANCKVLGRICAVTRSSRQLFKLVSTLPRLTSIDEPEYKTSHELWDMIDSSLGMDTCYRPNSKHRDPKVRGAMPKRQEDLVPRSMADSFDTIYIPLEKNEVIRRKYITFLGGVRVGRILEDLDIFSVWLGYKHVRLPEYCQAEGSPYAMVTALVDRIDFTYPALKSDKDIKISGHVSWVGKSSMEQRMYVDQKWDDGHWHSVTKAKFVVVAVDVRTQKPAVINPLVCKTPLEEQIFKKGVANHEMRMKGKKNSLLSNPPTVREREIIHEMFLQTVEPKSMNFKIVGKPPNKVWLDETSIKNFIICHPENRNVSNTIFGGFLMRNAYELAWANAYKFCRERPTVVHIDDIWFRRPVELGSLLKMHSQVVYTENPHILVKVSAEVCQPQFNTEEKTNHFYFTFQVGDSVPGVIPRSYTDAMQFLDGRRHYLELKSFSSINMC